MSYDHTAPVVLGVDGTPASDGALAYAVREATRRHVALHVVHVAPDYVPMAPMYPYLPDRVDDVARAVLRKARARIHGLDPRVSVTTELVLGPRVVSLVDAAARGQVVVVGHEGVVGLERLVAGTTTASVAARAEVPLVSVPEGWQSRPGPVVVGFAGARNDAALLGRSFARAAELGSPLVVVHAWKVPDAYADIIELRTHADSWAERDAAEIDRELAPWRAALPAVEVTVRVVHQKPAVALLDAARDAAHLVVVRNGPARPLGAHLGAHLGGVGRALLHAAPCPVEVVPASWSETVTPRPALEQAGVVPT